jgi:hypothetical protein
MFIYAGQIGLQNLSQEEAKEFIDFINADLTEGDAGTVRAVTSNEIHKNGLDSLMTVVGQAADVIEVAGFMYGAAKTTKKLPYFYAKSLEWLKKKNKSTEHMEQVKKMVDFMANEDHEEK